MLHHVEEVKYADARRAYEWIYIYGSRAEKTRSLGTEIYLSKLGMFISFALDVHVVLKLTTQSLDRKCLHFERAVVRTVIGQKQSRTKTSESWQR